MKPSVHRHPKTRLNNLIQYGAIVVVGLLLVSAPLQIVLTLTGAPEGFIVSALFTVLLAAPVLMLTAVAPPVTVDETGIMLKPLIWKKRFVPWSDVQAVKVFPLLPTEEQEINRKWVVGRNNYRAAQGIMLLIPGLPVQYRIAGFLAGERGRPIIALTNRAHTDYEHLVKIVLSQTDSKRHDNALTIES